MAVRVIKGQANDGSRIYKVNEIIYGLDIEEENRLISFGVAEAVEEEEYQEDGTETADEAKVEHENEVNPESEVKNEDEKESQREETSEKLEIKFDTEEYVQAAAPTPVPVPEPEPIRTSKRK